jgi:GT2 family glycosyltransferase
MLSRECIEKVGYFDEGFKRGYFEDNDFHYRMKLAGVKGVAITSALFYHYGSRTQNQIGVPGGIIPSELFLANRDYYIKKWNNEPGKEIYKYPFNDSSKDIKWTIQDNN